MKKAIAALVAAAAAVSSIGAFPALAASESWQSDADMTLLLSQLNIMNGDETGDYKLDSYVSRAEMTKMAVASSSYKNMVAVGLQFSPFSDVSGSYWAAPYIQAAVSAGIVEGYIDGTFDPNGTVTYEQAVTMMLRVLGYTSEDFGASYPYGQIGMAQSLEMTSGIDAEIGEPLTRREVARLICNTLGTGMKDTGADLITVHNCQIIDDVTIIASEDEDSSLTATEISTSSGKYTIDDTFDTAYVGSTGDMVIKDGKYLVAFSPDDETVSEKYVIYSTLNDAILCYEAGDNTNMHQIEISATTPCYMGSTAYTYSQLSSQMEMGDTIRIRYKSNGEVDYINYSEGTVEGPIKVMTDSWINSFDTNSSTKIVRDGNIVDESSIQINDIIYYSEDLNMILAYTTKVTGVYENASPSKDSPSSVTISGVTYEVEGVEAFNDLSSNGSFNYGDTVTVLMGRDGKIAGVVTAAAAATGTQVGYAVSSGRSTFNNSDGTTYTSYYIELVTADGTSYTYPTKADPSAYVGSVARAQLSDGYATVRRVSDMSLSGYVSYADMKIGTRSVSKDVKILDVSSEYTENAILYTRTYMQRLDGMELTQSQVVYYDTDSNGDISELILRNVTGDMYSYGIVTSRNSDTNTTVVDVGTSTYSTSSNYSVALGDGVRVGLNGSTITSLSKLRSYSGKADELTQSYAEIGGTKYKLSDKVVVYEKRDISEYSMISLNDAINGDYNCTCYYDKTEEQGGRIRVIVVTAK